MKLFLAGWLFIIFLIPASAQDSLQYDFFTVPASSVLLNDGQIDLRITSGSFPYSYYWSSGIHTENQSNLAPGIYTCTLVDGNAVPKKIYTEVLAPKAFDWTYTNTGENHIILIPQSGIQGIPFELGDYLGVFYKLDEQLICGGYIDCTAPGNFAVTAWGDAALSPEKDGFSAGEPFVFAWYDVSSQRQYFLQADFNTENFPNLGFYLPNGISGVEKIGNISQELAVNDMAVSPGFRIFPNPAAEEITVQTERHAQSPSSLKIFSSLGNLVYQKILLDESCEIRVTDWPAGVYIVFADDRLLTKLMVIHF